jgi:phosphate transport system protein
MADRTAAMVRQALDSYVNSDARAARIVIKLDDDVDADNDVIIDEIVQVMKQSPEAVEPGISLFSAVRHLERIADHATNIAEDVIYWVEGEIVRHKYEKM